MSALVGANEARRRLGYISAAMLTKLVKTGRLNVAMVNERGHKFFTAEELERFANIYPRARMRRGAKRKVTASDGRVSKRVFELFSKGKSLRDIVVECAVDPDRVRELWREWNTSLDAHEKQRRQEQLERRMARDQREVDRRAEAEERAVLKRRELDIRERELRRARPSPLLNPMHATTPVPDGTGGES